MNLELDEIVSNTTFYLIRSAILAIALILGYIVSTYILVPKVFDEWCLTHTENCNTIEIQLYNNTFVAKESMSQIPFFFDGNKLYIYGQAPGSCEKSLYFKPTNIFQLSLNKHGTLVFTPFPNECVSSVETIIDYYTRKLKIEKQTIYLKASEPLTNIFSIIKTMIDNNIFSVLK